MTTFVPLAGIEPDAVETLLDAAFGADRHGRTAYRIRAGMAALPDLSFAALDADRLIGTIQSWPIALHDEDGQSVPLTMVGPVAVAPDRQRDGVGQALMGHMLAEAARIGADTALMLIGDPEYYGRFFGFTADRTSGWRAPGPVEQHRLLARGGAVPDRPGVLGPRLTALA